MRKKLLTVTLSIFMALSLAACGSDNKDSDETDVIETTAEETNVEEFAEETSVEESATKEPATEGENTTEYQLAQMNSGFYGGIAWATVADDTGAKKVLINKDLQVVYELPEGMETGDIFDGKAVVIHSDQASNPGFLILGADGTVLYECSDYLTGGGGHGYNVNFTRDGGTIYERKESGLTANTAYACVLNNQFETIEQFDLSCYFEDNGSEIDMRRFYYCLSNGVYGVGDYGVSEGAIMKYILNTNEHNTVVNEEFHFYGVCNYFMDMDRCVVLLAFKQGWFVCANAGGLDYSGIADEKMLGDLIAGSGRTLDNNYNHIYEVDYGAEGQHIAVNHGIIAFTAQETTGIENIEGFDIPDFGANITSFKLSNDGKYIALKLRGADGNCYYTVIGSDGQKLYEPVTVDSLSSDDYGSNLYGTWGICDGYIMSQSGKGITPDGKVFQLGDGTALSGIGENSLLYTIERHGDEFCMISDGYIVCQSKLYRSDGTEVTTVTAINMQGTPVDSTNEITADGCGGLYSGSQQGKYYYVWLEMGEFSGIDAPMGIIRLLWEGNEPYTEGDELVQDSTHNFYMSDIDDGYMIKPGWNNEDSSILTIDEDEFGEYSGKIFCFGFWLNKDDSIIYDGTSLHYRD